MPIEERKKRKPNGSSSESEEEDSFEEERKLEKDPFDASSYEIGEHVDCLDTTNKWLNAEIINKRGNYLRVHYSGWSQKYDEWISLDSRRIQKQWKKNDDFQINNRLDILDERNVWLEARVIEIDHLRIKIHYFKYSSKYDDWIDMSSKRIDEVGSHSQAYGGVKYRKDTVKSPERVKKLNLLKDEDKFRLMLFKKSLTINEIGGDGNCLFRAFSDQLYGTEEHHKVIRAACLDYVEKEKDFYKDYVIGGEEGFEEYIEKKRMDGVWGDDLEIQAMSEIYNRSIEIYAYSDKPMRTFHEVSNKDAEPIRISYHGRSHYNSVKAIGQEKSGLLRANAGEIETEALKNAEARVEKRKASKTEQKNDKIEKEEDILMDDIIAQSRQEFENKGRRDMEIAMEESLVGIETEQTEKIMKNELEKTIKESLDSFQEKADEEALIKMAINESKKQSELDLESDLIKKALEESKKEFVQQYPPGVQQAIDAGFPLESVLTAYSIVGDDAEMIINFIYENS